MNIVLVGTAYPLRGGIAHYVALLFRHLSKRHVVSVVTFSRQYPSFLFPGKTQEEQGGDENFIPSVQWIDSINPWTWWQTGRRIAAMKPDLIVYKYWIPFFAPAYGVIAWLARRGGRTKIMFICDNVLPHEKRPGDTVFTRFAFRFVDSFIVQSKSVEQDLLRLKPAARYELIPHPVYEIFGEAIPKQEAKKKLGIVDERVILFFGYVRPYKGLDVLIDAMPEIVGKVGLKLLVVGEFYGGEEAARAQIAALPSAVRESVRVHADYVANDQVGDWFSACDVVVLPYRSATQSGIVQIAYQFNKPVIATDVGGLSEVVQNGKTGYIVPAADPHAVADAVVRFYKENREEEFVRNVKEEKKKYSWSAMVEGIERLAATERTGEGVN